MQPNPVFYENPQVSSDEALINIQPLGKLLGQNDQPLLLPWDLNGVIAGTNIVCFTDSGIPDLWIVSVRPAAGVRVSVYNGPQASGIPYRLGGGGYLKLPATSEYVTISIEAGSNAVSGTVVAVRKYSNFDIDPGELA